MMGIYKKLYFPRYFLTLFQKLKYFSENATYINDDEIEILVSPDIFDEDITNTTTSQLLDQTTSDISAPDGYLKTVKLYSKFLKLTFCLYYSDAKLISKAEYKIFLDQTVEVYRLRKKVSEIEKVEHILKTKNSAMESALKEKSNEIKELRQLIKFYEKEFRELSRKNANSDKQIPEVRIYIFSN